MDQKSTASRRGARKRSQRKPAEERESYKGHEIVIAPDDPGRRVLIDGVPIRCGRAGDGYFLSVYAYDRDTSLLTVVKRYLDHGDAAMKRQAKALAE